jgi:hypothetical protein
MLQFFLLLSISASWVRCQGVPINLSSAFVSAIFSNGERALQSAATTPGTSVFQFQLAYFAVPIASTLLFS